MIPRNLVFLACSGAETRHIFRDVAYPGEPIRTGGPPGPGLNQLSQWRWLLETFQLDARLVIVSIGGNDALFGEFGRVCALPGDCSELAARWLDNLEMTVAENVAMAYKEIRTTFPTVPVVAVPYPSPLRERACDWSTLTSNEHLFIHGFLHELNNVLEQAAKNEGLYYLQAMETTLEDKNLRICDQGPSSVGVNSLAANPVGGQLSDTLNPRHWFHNSLHPNQRGHEAMRDTLADWIRSHPNIGPAQPADNPTQYEVASIESIMGNPEFRHCGRPDSGLSHCDGSSWDWAGAKFVGSVWKGIVPLVLVAAGALFAWLQVIRAGRLRKIVGGLQNFAKRSADSSRDELRQRTRDVLNVLRGRRGSSKGQ